MVKQASISLIFLLHEFSCGFSKCGMKWLLSGLLEPSLLELDFFLQPASLYIG